MLYYLMSMQSFFLSAGFQIRSLISFAVSPSRISSTAILLFFSTAPLIAQKSELQPPPVIVQPGAPGEPTRMLPATTRAQLPPVSPKDFDFMRGMIMHHAQAVEMTALIEQRTADQALRALGARISHTQSDEIKFMMRWLETRGAEPAHPMTEMAGHHAGHHPLMPGMLSARQMKELENAKGAEFNRLFLKGMIQHHIGALIMVKDLFATPGAGQDAELFNFATDVDSSQRAEIKIMQKMLGENPQKEN